MTDKLLNIITEKHTTSGGHCGVYAAYLLTVLDVEYKELKKLLNQLFIENKITVHDGIHGTLIKLKK